MHEIITRHYRELLSIPISSENEQLIRETVQLLAAEIGFIKNLGSGENSLKYIYGGCLEYLRKLKIHIINDTKTLDYFACELDLYLSEIIYASDLILSLKNKRVLFASSPAKINCCPSLIGSAVLILISLLSQNNPSVNVNTRETTANVFINVESTKIIIDQNKDDLFAVQHIVKLHGGKIICAFFKNHVKFTLSLPKIKGDFEKCTIPDFSVCACGMFSGVQIILNGKQA